MDPLESIRQVFFQECDESLAELEAGLLAMETGDRDPETINGVFRAVHSVKGGAGAFGLEALVRYAHAYESLLDDVRAGRVGVNETVVKTLLRAMDVLADHVRAASGGPDVDPTRSAGMIAELNSLAAGKADDGLHPKVSEIAADTETCATPADKGMEDFDFQPVAAAVEETAPASGGWRIRFRPKAALYLSANEPALLLRELRRLGPTQVRREAGTVPPLDALDPEDAWLAWTIDLLAPVDEALVREVFEFVEAACDLDISPLPDAQAGEPSKACTTSPEAHGATLDVPDPVAAILAGIGGATEHPSQPSPEDPVGASGARAARAAANDGSQATATQATIRVDLERVDRLIDLVGELVIQQAMLSQRLAESGQARSSQMAVGLEELEQLTRAIQDSVMAIRAQPVKSVFQRMPRLVREVADMTGKKARLVTEGESTEVDKTVIERLSDPLTHMLRNAIDHGLEPPEARLAAGKPAEGTVRLCALHRSGRIVIEVEDDGRGIDRERVRAIAVSRGLVSPDADLTDDEVDNLIFLPGFSTAAEVSNISGRGVGMDVVRRSIQALGGRISITSQPGKGSRFTMSLPLTLAVLDGMVVEGGGQTLVAPLSAIVESLTPRPEEIHNLGGRDAVMRVRDVFVPIIDVGLALGFRATPASVTDCVAMLVEVEGGGKAALMVDAIHGQRQVVIKSLETNYRHIQGIAAATILGDGRVALILDVDALVGASRRKATPQDFKLAS